MLGEKTGSKIKIVSDNFFNGLEGVLEKCLEGRVEVTVIRENGTSFTYSGKESDIEIQD